MYILRTYMSNIQRYRCLCREKWKKESWSILSAHFRRHASLFRPASQRLTIRSRRTTCRYICKEEVGGPLQGRSQGLGPGHRRLNSSILFSSTTTLKKIPHNSLQKPDGTGFETKKKNKNYWTGTRRRVANKGKRISQCQIDCHEHHFVLALTSLRSNTTCFARHLLNS